MAFSVRQAETWAEQVGKFVMIAVLGQTCFRAERFANADVVPAGTRAPALSIILADRRSIQVVKLVDFTRGGRLFVNIFNLHLENSSVHVGRSVAILHSNVDVAINTPVRAPRILNDPIVLVARLVKANDCNCMIYSFSFAAHI